MKNKFKKLNYIILPIFVIALTLSSCKKEIAKPVITDFELGYDNSGVAVLGSDLHIDATIVAEGKIDKIEVHIHFEGGQGWEYEKEYQGSYAGLKNTSFHEHVEIPTNIDTGAYHFHFQVIDKEGNSTEVERELNINSTK